MKKESLNNNNNATTATTQYNNWNNKKTKQWHLNFITFSYAFQKEPFFLTQNDLWHRLEHILNQFTNMSKRVSRSLATRCPILASSKELRALSPSEDEMLSGHISVYMHIKNESHNKHLCMTLWRNSTRRFVQTSHRSLCLSLWAMASGDILLVS